MHIYVVEGPAGSGKTTALRESGLTIVDWREPENLRPRSYGHDQEWKADIKDLTNFRATLTGSPWDDVEVGLDRFLLSSLVYDSLRGNPIPASHEFESWMRAWAMTLSSLAVSVQARDSQFSSSSIFIHWKIFKISELSLIKRRSSAARHYPWFAIEEIKAYAKVTERVEECLSKPPVRQGWPLNLAFTFQVLDQDEETEWQWWTEE